MGKLRPENVLNLAKRIHSEGAGIPVPPTPPQELKKRVSPKKQNKNLGARGKARWVRTDTVTATGHNVKPPT